MDSQDRRVRRTQNLLAKALIALSLEKGYEAVSIRDITARADVGYATFFRHYTDKDALLLEVMEVILEDLMKLLDLKATDLDPITTGQLIFRYVEDHSELCRVLFHSRGSATLVKTIRAAGAKNVLGKNMPLPGSLVPLEIAANHIVSAALALIEWWLDHNMPYPTEQMGQIYAQLIAQPTRALAFAPL